MPTTSCASAAIAANRIASVPSDDRPAPRIGRPRKYDGTVSVRLTSELHIRLVQEASRLRVDVSDVIRDVLSRHFVSQNSTKFPVEP